MSEEIRCAIVDDEDLARANILHLLRRESDFQVALSTGDPRKAISMVTSSAIDLIFLDIRMPEIDGLTFLHRLREVFEAQVSKLPYAILVTAFDQFALQAFEYEALDYLVKPFSDERFGQSLERARKRIRFPRYCSPSVTEEKVAFKTRNGTLKICPSEITWIESSGHYITIHGLARSHLSRARISEVETRLKTFGFVRVHRGALVNLKQVTRHQRQGDERQLVMADGSLVAVGRRRWNDVRQRLEHTENVAHRQI